MDVQQKVDGVFYIYVHKRNDTNKVFYVGKGKDRRAWSKQYRNKYWANVSSKHGYSVEILFQGLTEEDAFQAEIDVITELRYFCEPLTNMTNGGEGSSGRVLTEEQKRAIGEKSKSTKTPEVLAKMSKAAKGRTHSEEAKQKIAYSLKDRVFTEEHRRKLSENNKMKDPDVARRQHEARRKTMEANPEKYTGVNASRSDKSIYTFRNRYTGELFTGNIFDFSETFNLNRANVKTITNGQCAYTGDWEMYDESKDNTILLVRKSKEPKIPKGRHQPKGESNPRYDKTVYTFIHMGTGIVERCTSFELQTKHSLSKNIRAVVLGKIVESGGWRLIENKDRKINRNGSTV